MTASPPPPDHAWVIHPFLFGLLPPVSLFSVNAGWTEARELLAPLIGALTLPGVLCIALWPALPDARKRGLVLSGFWIPFYSYGSGVEFARAHLGAGALLSAPAIVAAGAAIALMALAAILGLRRAPWRLLGPTRFLNHFAVMTLIVALVSCATALARRPASDGPDPVAPAASVAPAGSTRDVGVRLDAGAVAALPNIFFIVCDAYPRADHLKSYFEFDNSPFLEALRSRGFFVAERSRSNYGNTLPSLASTLNLTYLDPAVLDPENFRRNHRELIGMIQNAHAIRTLRAHGYEYVAVPSGMFPAMMAGADRFLFPGGARTTEAAAAATGRHNRASALDITEYQQAVIDMTPLRSAMNRIGQLWWYQLVPYSTSQLENLRRNDGPMFVFAHLLAPHVPHAYDESGNFVDTFPPYKAGWRTVTTYLNGRLLEVVDAIRVAEPHSIVIILGDHGSNTSMPNAQGKTAVPWEGDWPEYVRDRSANLLACYLPDRSASELLYPELTSVNLLRLIFDAYLKTSHGRLEDATYLRPRDGGELVRIAEIY